MPVTSEFLKELDTEYLRLNALSQDAAPRGGSIPVGGGDWMDYFFKAEAVHGMLSSLRHRKTYKQSFANGCAASRGAIKIWNSRREYQVRRWEGWVEDFLESVCRRCSRSVSEKLRVRGK